MHSLHACGPAMDGADAGGLFIDEMDTLAYDLGKWLMPFRTTPSDDTTIELNDYTQLISQFVSLFKELKCASFCISYTFVGGLFFWGDGLFCFERCLCESCLCESCLCERCHFCCLCVTALKLFLVAVRGEMERCQCSQENNLDCFCQCGES